MWVDKLVLYLDQSLINGIHHIYNSFMVKIDQSLPMITITHYILISFHFSYCFCILKIIN